MKKLGLMRRRDTGNFCITDQYHSPRPTNGAHPHTLCLGQSICIHHRHAVHHGLVAVFGASHLWVGQRQQGQFAPLGAWVSELVVCDCLWSCTCISLTSRNGITAARTHLPPVLGMPEHLLTKQRYAVQLWRIQAPERLPPPPPRVQAAPAPASPAEAAAEGDLEAGLVAPTVAAPRPAAPSGPSRLARIRDSFESSPRLTCELHPFLIRRLPAAYRCAGSLYSIPR